MKNLFRFASVILSVILVMGFFVFSSMPASAAKQKITLWHYVDVGPLVQEFNASQTAIEIEAVKMSHPDIMNKLGIALAAGVGAPDIFMMTHRHFINFSSTERLMDITDYLKDDMDKITEAHQVISSYKGKIYGVSMDVAPSVVWYRRDIFEQNGIASISTFSEFEEAARKLKENGIAIMPIFYPAGTWGCNAVSMFLGSRGANVFSADGKVIRDNKELEFIFDWMYRMYKEGLGEAVVLNSPEMWGEFKAGNIATWPMNTAEGRSIKLNMPELEGKWGVMNFPKWDDKNEQLSGVWGGITFGIPDQSAVKEKSVEFLKWLGLTVEGQIAASKSWNAVPAYNEALKDPYYGAGDLYYGGDNVYESINSMLPVYYYDWAVVEKHMGTQLDLMFAGKITPKQAARAVEKAIADETGR